MKFFFFSLTSSISEGIIIESWSAKRHVIIISFSYNLRLLSWKLYVLWCISSGILSINLPWSLPFIVVSKFIFKIIFRSSIIWCLFNRLLKGLLILQKYIFLSKNIHFDHIMLLKITNFLIQTSNLTLKQLFCLLVLVLSLIL